MSTVGLCSAYTMFSSISHSRFNLKWWKKLYESKTEEDQIRGGGWRDGGWLEDAMQLSSARFTVPLFSVHIHSISHQCCL